MPRQCGSIPRRGPYLLGGTDMAKRTTPVYTRMMQRVSVDTNTGCWNFDGAKGGSMGYGVLQRGRRGEGLIRAHHVSWLHYRGDIPNDRVIDHICNNPACVNPDHLQAITNRENILRGNSIAARNARKTCCPRCQGEYTQTNAGRKCVPCSRNRTKRSE
jgi:hypothetical protein